MKKLSKCRRLISFVFALLITVYTTISSFASTGVVLADESSAMQRVTNFISLAAGKSIQNMDMSLELTKDELRFLGVYLSNFYIPFGTELGVTETEANESTKTQIVTALQKELHFDDALAETFAETIMGLSRSNCQELCFKVSAGYQDGTYVDLPSFKANYFNFLRLMMGGSIATSVFEGYYYKSGYPIYQDLYKGNTYGYGYFGYEKDGNFIPMFDCSLTNRDRTPSQETFLQCLFSVDTEAGYGFSFFDFTKEEAEGKEELKDMLSTLDENTVYQMSIYGSTINADCFGNIILKGANHQYIIVPGCMNPYTWVVVDKEGEDLYSAGNAYNTITFMGMGLSDTGKMFDTSQNIFDDTATDSPIRWAKLNVNGMLDTATLTYVNNVSWTTKVKNSKGEWADKKVSVNLVPLKFVRGGTDYALSGKFLTNDYYDLVDKATQGFINANSGDWSYYASVYDRTAKVWDKMSLFDPTPKKFVALKGSMSDQLNTIKYIDNFVFIDNLGAFHFDESDSQIDYNCINVLHYTGKDFVTPNALFTNWGNDPANGFNNMYKAIKSGDLNTIVTAETSGIVGTYTTYALAGLYNDTEDSKKATIGLLGYRINRDNMVEISKDPISIPSSMVDDMIIQSIRDWIYYILHPEKGTDYFRILITNKVEALLVGWHNDMVGTKDVGATTGTTLYRSNTGYVTTPDLTEIEWTNSLLNFYRELIPFFIVAMVVVMLFSYITGVMSLQRCAFGLVLFSCFLFTPITLINSVVGISNRVTQNIYGERFTYWALVQQESYADALDEASSGESYSNYLKTLYATNNSQYSNQGSDSVVLKWQAPKKMASLMLSTSDSNVTGGLSNSRLLNLVLSDSAYSGETYLKGENNYMYRSYTDLGNFSRYIYNGIYNANKPARRSLSTSIYSQVSSDLKANIKSMNANYTEDRNLGYANKNGDGSSGISGQIRTVVPLSSEMYNNALKQKGKVKDLTIKKGIGLNQDLFNFSVAMFNNADLDYKENIINSAQEDNKSTIKNYLKNYKDKDITGLAAYSLMSESPFYYYSWSLYDMGMSTSSAATNGYKSVLLNQSNGGFFYNNIGNGELKDFMDMKSLFTYIIPYLKEGNDLVKEWDEVYGLFIYDGVPTEEGHMGDTEISKNTELKRKYWHNRNVARLYGIYSPWVDLMYDCSYANPETIVVMGETYTVTDPINPASYPEERPMIFSESEMFDYGLTRSDLTEVERRILDCQQGMQERMYELLNYYNFSDLTLNTAAAINCTFEFNTTFSDTGVLKGNINLYPQSFEIADFSYDAFLRFILSTSTGEDITNKDDFYLNIVNNSSITTAIVMLVLDILSQFALPMVRIFFIVAVFISAILLVLVTSFRVDPEMKFIPKLIKGLVVPMLEFLLSTIGFAWVVSLFMGVGSNMVTQTKTLSISMGDPVIAMLAMCALDLLILLIYYKVLKGIIKDITRNFKLVSNYSMGILGGITSMIGGVVSGNFGKGIEMSSNGGSTNVKGDGFNQEGLGRESVRAVRRAGDTVELTEEFSERVNDTKKSTFHQQNNESSKPQEAEKKKEDLDNIIKSGSEKINRG